MSFKLAGTEKEIECFYRDPLECVKVLFGNSAWAKDLHVAPERHYTDESRSTRVYDEMSTGNWWWRTQVSLNTILDNILFRLA